MVIGCTKSKMSEMRLIFKDEPFRHSCKRCCKEIKEPFGDDDRKGNRQKSDKACKKIFSHDSEGGLGMMTPQETMYLMASSGFMSMIIKSFFLIIKRNPVVGLGVVGTSTEMSISFAALEQTSGDSREMSP